MPDLISERQANATEHSYMDGYRDGRLPAINLLVEHTTVTSRSVDFKIPAHHRLVLVVPDSTR